MNHLHELYDSATQGAIKGKTALPPKFDHMKVADLDLYLDPKIDKQQFFDILFRVTELLEYPDFAFDSVKLCVIHQPYLTVATGKNAATVSVVYLPDGDFIELLLCIDTRQPNWINCLVHELIHVFDHACQMSKTTHSSFAPKADQQKFDYNRADDPKYISEYALSNALKRQLAYCRATPAEELVLAVYKELYDNPIDAMDMAHGVSESALLELKDMVKAGAIKKKTAQTVVKSIITSSKHLGIEQVKQISKMAKDIRLI